MGRGLKRINQRLARRSALQALKLFSGNHNHFIAAMHRDMLRPFTADTTHQLTETRLRILERPTGHDAG